MSQLGPAAERACTSCGRHFHGCSHSQNPANGRGDCCARCNHPGEPTTTGFPAVDTIRRAATLMRERATNATLGPWRYDRDLGDAYSHGVIISESPNVHGWDRVVVEADLSTAQQRDQVEHIAAWSPTVALAVADWLDIGANPYACVNIEPMLAVARAYLREAGDLPSQVHQVTVEATVDPTFPVWETGRWWCVCGKRSVHDQLFRPVANRQAEEHAGPTGTVTVIGDQHA